MLPFSSFISELVMRRHLNNLACYVGGAVVGLLLFVLFLHGLDAL